MNMDMIFDIIDGFLLVGAMILIFLAHRRINILEYAKSTQICSCSICQHVSTLSDEALKDIIDEAIPETNE